MRSRICLAETTRGPLYRLTCPSTPDTPHPWIRPTEPKQHPRPACLTARRNTFPPTSTHNRDGPSNTHILLVTPPIVRLDRRQRDLRSNPCLGRPLTQPDYMTAARLVAVKAATSASVTAPVIGSVISCPTNTT